MKTIISILSFCLALQHGLVSSPANSLSTDNVADFNTQESFYLKVVIDDSLKSKGFSTNKEAVISSDTDSVNNLARVYVDFAKDFHGVVTLTAYDVTGFKMGDCKMPIDANTGDALYFDFHFDKRVDIQQDSKIVLW